MKNMEQLIKEKESFIEQLDEEKQQVIDQSIKDVNELKQNIDKLLKEKIAENFTKNQIITNKTKEIEEIQIKHKELLEAKD